MIESERALGVWGANRNSANRWGENRMIKWGVSQEKICRKAKKNVVLWRIFCLKFMWKIAKKKNRFVLRIWRFFGFGGKNRGSFGKKYSCLGGVLC